MDSVNECVIEWLRGEKTATVTMPNNTTLKSKILNLAKKNACVEVFENKDGSILAHIPVSWIRIYPPRQLTDEEKEERLSRLRKG